VGGVEVFNEFLRRALGPIEVFADGRPGLLGGLGDLGRVGLEQPVGAVRASRELLRRHREERFDVILSNGVYGWPLTLAKPGVPLVQVYHFTMAGFARHALSLRGDRLTTGRVTALFDRLAGIGKNVVAVSPRVLREVESFYGLHGRILPQPVDTQAFHPVDRARARDALGLPQGAAIGLFVGRADHTKGYDILLRVARLMPEVLFLVAGGGGAGGNGGALDTVRPLGRIPHPDMPLWYSASDFFFLPSRYEGFGLALLEALSCNIPAVVSEPAWPFSEPPARCGVAVRGESEQDFATAIRFVLAEGTKFSPREFILPRYNFPVFQQAWRAFIDSIVRQDSLPLPT